MPSLRIVRVHDLSVPGNLSRVSWKLSRTVLRGGTNSNVGPLLGDGEKLHTVPGTPNAPNDSSFYGNMLVLPTGQILLTDFSDDIELFTPQGGGPQPQWGPVVTSYPSSVQPGGTYTISGIRLNGMSQDAAYGDDVQAATNYPIVRITNMRTKHVFYSRTHDHSSMAVASNALVSTSFDVPAN